MKKFKVGYSYPLEHPIKVVIRRLSKQGLIGWLMQKYGYTVDEKEIVISERIIELPTLHQWLGKIFSKTEGNLLEIGHVASSTAIELASLGYKITAIDLREYPFMHPNLLSIKGDFLKFEFNKKFNCIYSLSTIEHFGFSKRYNGEDSQDDSLDEQAFAKISNLLEAGGKAIISVPYAKSLDFKTWFRVYTKDSLNKKLGKYFNIEDQRFYKRENNIWQSVFGTTDPISPHDGVALFLLSKKY